MPSSNRASSPLSCFVIFLYPFNPCAGSMLSKSTQIHSSSSPFPSTLTGSSISYIILQWNRSESWLLISTFNYVFSCFFLESNQARCSEFVEKNFGWKVKGPLGPRTPGGGRGVHSVRLVLIGSKSLSRAWVGRAVSDSIPRFSKPISFRTRYLVRKWNARNM